MKRALISVTDKTGLLDLVDGIQNLGYQVISTGGTLKFILDNGRNAIPIEEFTGFPEMFDGRTKTLHPKVHGGILYIRDNENHVNQATQQGIESIDMVVVNLYDFEGAINSNKSHGEIIENIDIGGPSMIRSAAKNHKDVLVVVDPKDYYKVIEKAQNNAIDLDFRVQMAMKAFSLTAYYDGMISNYFVKQAKSKDSEQNLDFNSFDLELRSIPLRKSQSLRYGENPHQEAAVYDIPYQKSLLSYINQLSGKELSYNNLNDLNTAVEICADFADSKLITTSVIKHANPCAVAMAENSFDSYMKAYEADSLSIFGGIIATNGVVDKATAEEINKIFVEIVAAKEFTKEAIQILTQKQNLRLIEIDYSKKPYSEIYKNINGKMLVQSADIDFPEGNHIATKKTPSPKEMEDLLFAMKVSKHTKSNAIVIAKDLTTVAIGSGQTSRIWALETALNNNKNKNFQQTVMGSDAFFPFADCVELASQYGITAIIQPGGAIKDQESIDLCDKKGISMVMTGVRHFKH